MPFGDLMHLPSDIKERKQARRLPFCISEERLENMKQKLGVIVCLGSNYGPSKTTLKQYLNSMYSLLSC